MKAMLDGEELGRGAATTKKEAEQLAALNALEKYVFTSESTEELRKKNRD